MNRTGVEEIQSNAGSPSVRHEFEQVAVNMRPQIFRFLLASSRDMDLAETLTQECFLKAYSSWSSFRGESSARTWFMRIAINLQKDHWRNRRLQFWRTIHSNAVDTDEAANWVTSNERSPEEHLLAREQVARVWRAVDKLTIRQRRVFLLRFVEDLGFGEIAEATGMRTGTIKAHMSRALAKVRHELRRD